MKSIQKNHNIAYLGIPGSFSFAAGEKFFSDGKNLVGFKTIKEIFESVEIEKSTYGIVPFENTSTGALKNIYDQLLDRQIFITGEIILRIHHQLFMKNKFSRNLNSIKKIYSHMQAIDQCKKMFKKYDNIEKVYISDTASAAKYLSEYGLKNEAVIAGKRAGELYNLKIVKENIEDNKTNFTRFIVIGNKNNRTGNKTSLVFSVTHKPGSLFSALKPFAINKLNMTKIESRPVFGKPWEYIFFVDFELKNNNKLFDDCLKQMKEVCHFVKVLGIYKKGRIYET